MLKVSGTAGGSLLHVPAHCFRRAAGLPSESEGGVRMQVGVGGEGHGR